MNSLPFETRLRILGMLVQGSSIKRVCGVMDVSKTTVLKLLADVGEACGRYHDRHLTALACRNVEVKKIWSFSASTSEVHSWMAMDEETKLVVCWQMGTDSESEKNFVNDVIDRLKNHVQFEIDGDRTFLKAVEGAGKTNVCQSVLSSTDDSEDAEGGGGSSVLTVRLNVEPQMIRTSGIARRLTNYMRAFNLHFMHYNFCRVQGPEAVTPAMSAGLADRVWNLGELLGIEDFGEERAS